MLLKNQILTHRESGKRFRILAAAPSGDTVWVFDLDDPLALPADLPLDLAEDPEIFEVQTSKGNAALLHVSETAKRHRDDAFKLIEPLVATQDIFEASKRSALINRRIDETGHSRDRLYRLLRQWWRNGQDRLALTPKFKARGNPSGDTHNRGRRPQFASGIYQMRAEDQLLIDAVLKSHYLNSELPTLSDAYQTLRELHFSHLDTTGHRILKTAGECPSYRQFCYYAHKSVTFENIIRARKGDAAFALAHRPVLGSLRGSTYAVGDAYEIDSTIADVYLVHHADRHKLIGKPSLYLIRDRKSSLIVGFYIGLEESSWTAAQQAILSLFQDKQELCTRYGVPYDPADWPAHAIMPKQFVADRGAEMTSGASSQISDLLEVTVLNLPARRGDWKPFVELGFKQIQRTLRTVAPGYTPPENFGKRQVRDYSQDAAMTLPEFTHLVLQAIRKQNRKPIRDYPLGQEEILSGMQPTALNLWNHNVRTRAGLMDTLSEQEARFALLSQAQVSVTEEGIAFQDCFYSAPQAEERGWFTAARRKRFKVKASFDLRSVDTLYIHDEESPEGYFVATLLEKSRRFSGLSFRELEALNYLTKKRQAQGTQIDAQLASDFNADTKSTVDKAKALTKLATRGKTRRSRRQDTREAREDARRIERNNDRNLAVAPAPVTPSDSKDIAPATQSAKPKTMPQRFLKFLEGK